jgi:hypothetical protein
MLLLALPLVAAAAAAAAGLVALSDLAVGL